MTSYIKLSTNDYPRHIGDIEIDSIGVEDYAHVEWVDMPIFDKVTQRCGAGTPVEIDGKWYMTWIVCDLNQEEIDLENTFYNFIKPKL